MEEVSRIALPSWLHRLTLIYATLTSRALGEVPPSLQVIVPVGSSLPVVPTRRGSGGRMLSAVVPRVLRMRSVGPPWKAALVVGARLRSIMTNRRRDGCTFNAWSKLKNYM